MCNLRRLGILTLSAGVLAVPAPASFAQPAAGPKEEAAEVIRLPTDTRQWKKVAAAADYLKEEAWPEAARVLQSLLDVEPEAFVRVRRKDAAGKETTTWVSVRGEADRLLAGMPPKGREVYEQLYGETAALLLRSARNRTDDEELVRVVVSYFHTRAGAEATRLLATRQAADGHLGSAARLFERVLPRQGPMEWPPEALYEATRAFRRVGDRDHAEQTWKLLKGKAEGGKLRIGDRVRTVAEWEAELAKPAPGGERKDWPVYRGDPARSDHGDGDKPFMDPSQSYPTVREDQTRGLLDQAVRMAESRGQPVLPAFFPVAADGKLVYRDFWGVHARDLRTHRLRWESDSRYSFDRVFNAADSGNKGTTVSQWAQQYLQMSRPGMLYENSVVGTLSTDGSRVFLVEDLYLPPVGQPIPWGGPMGIPGGRNAGYGALADAVYVNRLNAYSLRIGKLLWDVSAGGDGDDKGEGYFLGPPLPLRGKLYVLSQKNQDLRLLCLDPARGDLKWSKLLATTQTKLSEDPGRRIQAAHLAYGEGVLVCPTNAGMLLGVELLSHSVIWAHPYPEMPKPAGPRIRPGMAGGPAGLGLNNVRGIGWKVTAPVVQDGRVVFAAPDGDSVRCLNLRDGALVWTAPRAANDLYLAGAAGGKVLIVGKTECRALSLADGSPVWHLTTGLPSGQGVFSGRRYYLPLKEGRGREPEVCTIDVDTGKDVAHTRSRRKEVPGNLVLVEGNVLSQTLDQVAVYPQMKAKLREMEALLARDPQDPVGLAERADLRLDDGDLAGAVRDLHAALQNTPPRDTRAQIRTRLYDALTQYLQQDFGAAEKYLDDYRALCKVEPDPGVLAEAKRRAETEERRRTGNYLMLLARGRETQGRLTDALRSYLDLVHLAGRGQELVGVPGEAALRARADVWARGRISALTARARPEQRQALDKEIARLWEAVRDAEDTPKLRAFVALFGDTAVGREGRLLLAERLAADRDFLKAEQQLLILRGQSGDPQTAARATDALARLCAGKGLHEDAVFWYRTLARDYPRVIVRDGKTGADLLTDLATDKRFLPYLEEPAWAGAGGRVTVQIDATGGPQAQPLFQFEPDGEVLPFLRHLRVTLEPQTHSLRLYDRDNAEVGHVPLTRTNFFPFLQQQGQSAPGQGPRYVYHTVGHVIVLPVGHLVFGIDALNKGELLWEKSLLGAQSPIANGAQVTTDPKDGSAQVLYPDGFLQWLGETGPVRPGYVCLQAREGLVALDPVTGETLWTRSDVGPRSRVFGDDGHVYLAEMSAEGNPSGTRAFRAADGVTVPDVPDFGGAFQQRQRLDDGRLLAADSRDGKLRVRLYDVPTGKDVWKQECPPGSVVVHCEDPHQGGVLRPDGTLTVLDLRSGREILKARMDPQDVGKARGATLLHDRSQWYLAIDGPHDVNAAAWGGPVSNFLPGTGYRCVPVNGKVYAFDRATGKVNWATIEVPQQMLVLEQFRDLPFLLLTSRYNRLTGQGPNRWATPGVGLTVIDKRSGKLIMDKKDLTNAQQFHTLRVDLREGKVELVSFNLKVTITLESPRAPGR